MAYQLSRRQWAFSIAYGQSMITLLVLLNVFFPQYLNLTFIIFIIGMVAFTAITMKTQLRHIVGKEAKEIKEGRKLFVGRPREVTELQRSDPRLVGELKPMLKSSLMSFLGLIVILVWYPLYFNVVGGVARDPEVDVITRVLLFLAGYEIPYLMITGMNLLSRRGVKEYIQVVNKYEVYDRGIVGMGIAAKFPLEGYAVNVNPTRKFVELIKSSGKAVVKYRFYTKSYDRLADIIRRYGEPRRLEFKRR